MAMPWFLRSATLGDLSITVLLQSMEFYKTDHVMFLGHVSKYVGGNIFLDIAKKVLQKETMAYKNDVYLLPRELDEKVVRLHLSLWIPAAPEHNRW